MSFLQEQTLHPLVTSCQVGAAPSALSTRQHLLCNVHAQTHQKTALLNKLISEYLSEHI